jgi:hypothetical protein
MSKIDILIIVIALVASLLLQIAGGMKGGIFGFGAALMMYGASTFFFGGMFYLMEEYGYGKRGERAIKRTTLERLRRFMGRFLLVSGLCTIVGLVLLFLETLR